MTPEQTQNLANLSLKLSGLGIRGAGFKRIEGGPVVTTYYFSLGPFTPIAKIMNKEEDFALSCGVESCLITREGGEIAIAIPNTVRTIVDFDHCLYHLATNSETRGMKLPIMLGVNTVGKEAVIDLTEQPHILIAGQTGGGKSVLLASIISGLATTRSEKELKLILVDTKKLDLPLFSDLPHCIDSVDTVEKFHDSFNRLMQIVRDRTTQMQGIARNISEWNALGLGKKYCYYVVIIDELADLIDGDNQLHADQIEPYCSYPKVQARLKSLLQICRAAGVHVICATQRSSVKVINGDIKANLPTRIALRLPSRFDSSTILSGGGAEQLLGKGDMLVESTLTASAVRYHGAYVDMAHIANILSQHDRLREQFAGIAEVTQ